MTPRVGVGVFVADPPTYIHLYKKINGKFHFCGGVAVFLISGRSKKVPLFLKNRLNKRLPLIIIVYNI